MKKLLKELFEDQFVSITAVPSVTLDQEEKQKEKERLLINLFGKTINNLKYY